MADQHMGLYVHIPFCSSKCDYCDFVSFSMNNKAQQQYLEALFAEIDRLKFKFVDKTFDTIFIGGGTPSVVYEGFIVSLARKLFSSFHFTEKVEFSIEVNPSSFTREKFFEYIQAGVNRISVGVQCLDEKLMAKHGRVQELENIHETFKILNESQFDNVNTDIMIGLPGQSTESVMETAIYLIKNRVKHISAYSLQVEKNTVLYNKIREGLLKQTKERKIISIYNKLNKILEKEGFKRYEVSNFAKAGFECKHNKKYWNETNYLGIGVSAYSYIDGYRYYNTKRLDSYIDYLTHGKSPVYSKEYVSDKERRTEKIMLSLRTEKGLNLEEFKNEFKEDLLKTKEEQIKNLIKLKMLTIKDGYLKLTPENFYVSNSIIVELI